MRPRQTPPQSEPIRPGHVAERPASHWSTQIGGGPVAGACDRRLTASSSPRFFGEIESTAQQGAEGGSGAAIMMIDEMAAMLN